MARYCAWRRWPSVHTGSGGTRGHAKPRPWFARRRAACQLRRMGMWCACHVAVAVARSRRGRAARAGRVSGRQRRQTALQLVMICAAGWMRKTGPRGSCHVKGDSTGRPRWDKGLSDGRPFGWASPRVGACDGRGCDGGGRCSARWRRDGGGGVGSSGRGRGHRCSATGVAAAVVRRKNRPIAASPPGGQAEAWAGRVPGLGGGGGQLGQPMTSWQR